MGNHIKTRPRATQAHGKVADGRQAPALRRGSGQASCRRESRRLEALSTLLRVARQDRSRWRLIDATADVVTRAEEILLRVQIRTLDAIHLAAAQMIAPELDAVVTYDRRLADGALLLGFNVVAPAGR